ncbi:MAG: S8 family serine peptidase, partial [Flavobacteriales bacterium]
MNSSYIDEIASIEGIQVHFSSKWFNAISISSADSTLLPIILNLPFVQQAEQLKRAQKQDPYRSKWNQEKSASGGSNSINQLEMIGLNQLHEFGFTGAGIDIAVFDSGFTLADVLPALSSLWSENRVKQMQDLYDGDNWVFHHQHGTFVLSILAGNQENELIGSAPKANYYLFRTEVTDFENRLEEDNWVVAAERADSIGVDIINSSLGYSIFSDSTQSYTYADMNGATTRISQAAQWASEKGILVVCSAGNQGSGSWRYITAPADAEGVLTVGAVQANGDHAAFSSFGPTADGRLKPNVVAQGQATSYASLDSTIRTGNGTSFPAPIISGAAACLMQAHPEMSSFEIKKLIEEGSSLYPQSNDSLGFGLPNFFKIHDLLSRWEVEENKLLLYPNPTSSQLKLLMPLTDEITPKILIYNALGQLVYESDEVTCGKDFFNANLNLSALSPGTYTLQ